LVRLCVDPVRATIDYTASWMNQLCIIGFVSQINYLFYVLVVIIMLGIIKLQCYDDV
jgi:hypothetical protein